MLGQGSACYAGSSVETSFFPLHQPVISGNSSPFTPPAQELELDSGSPPGRKWPGPAQLLPPGGFPQTTGHSSGQRQSNQPASTIHTLSSSIPSIFHNPWLSICSFKQPPFFFLLYFFSCSFASYSLPSLSTENPSTPFLVIAAGSGLEAASFSLVVRPSWVFVLPGSPFSKENSLIAFLLDQWFADFRFLMGEYNASLRFLVMHLPQTSTAVIGLELGYPGSERKRGDTSRSPVFFVHCLFHDLTWMGFP